MARKIKEETYIARRQEILDASYRLVYSKGFDQMTVQDIIDDLQISKGAFYHYFSSKSEVLEALVERIVDEVEPALIAIVNEPDRSALDKLQAYFYEANRWKSARKSLVLSLLQVWYADENAIVRQKVFSSMVKRSTPWLIKIIHQGIAEGVFNTQYPEFVCQINTYLFEGLSDSFIELLLTESKDVSQITQVKQALAAYTDAFERILGISSGSLTLIEEETLQEWFT